MKADNRYTVLDILGIILFGALLCLVIASVAAGQEHRHPPQDAALHEQFYNGWRKPHMRSETGQRYASCCNLHDCYPTQFKRQGGTWFAQRREDGVWMPVPANVLEHNHLDGRETPDGRGHVCANAPLAEHDVITVHCAVIGDPET